MFYNIFGTCCSACINLLSLSKFAITNQIKQVIMSETKTHWKKLENPDYIGAYSLDQGKDLIVMSENVKREMVTGTGGKKEECTVAYLKDQKPFIINRTNAKAISKVCQSPYIEDWKGKYIQLFVALIRAFGEDNVECLRVRPTAVKVELPQLLPTDTVNWNRVVGAVKNGYTVDQVRVKWSISEAHAQMIKQEAGR